MKSINNTTKEQILWLLQKQQSISGVAKAVGVNKATVSRLKNAFLPTLPRQASGRPYILSDIKLRQINRNVLKGDCTTGKDVHKRLQQEGIQISYQTILNSLRKIRIDPRKKSKKPFLSKKHQQERLKWARAHQHWTVDDWRRVIFSDETKINLWNSDGIKYCLRKLDTPLQPFHIEETVKHGGGNLMFWGCMTSKGLGYGCQIYDGTMKAVDYIGILDTTLWDSLEYYEYEPGDFIFQHDNDRKHTATATKIYLEDKGIEVLPWPSQSADLNPIEHVWKYLKVQIGLRDKRPTSIHDLWQVVLEEWERIPAQFIQSLYTSMPRRVHAVLKAKGGHTRY
jgi:transposase